MDDQRPDVWQNRCECGWDDGDERPGWRDRYRLHVAVAVFALPEVAALRADAEKWREAESLRAAWPEFARITTDDLADLRARAAAADRVEAALSFTPWFVTAPEFRRYIRRALDGDQS